ncbi:MAG: efflux RND transporter periplasmic adaptor subunit [Magnetococcales bacterium]|nr:efflux RND transporter periplasmic adaptor subunit [Magnetococcales bacterium]
MNGEARKLVNVRWESWRQVGEFSGSPEAFWQAWARVVTEGSGAELGVLYYRHAPREESGVGSWTILTHWPEAPLEQLPELERGVAMPLIEEARLLGVAHGPCLLGQWRVGLIGLTLDKEQGEVVLVTHLGAGGLAESDARHWLGMFRALPILYEARRAARQGERDAQRLAQTIELTGRILESEQFDQAAMAVVHELSERFACETVSMSWYQGGVLRLRAMSHSDRIDRRSELTALLEEVGQEALTQRGEVAYPGQGKLVTRAHQQYFELQRPGHLLTLPIFRDEEPLGSVTLERRRMAFSGAEQWALRLLCDMLPGPMRFLEERARSLPKRLWDETWRSVPARWKPVSGPGKRLVVLLVVAGIVGLLSPVPYHVSATGIVKTDTMAFIGAPFDGYLESASVTLGATVKSGDLLFSLATRELVLEKAGILADQAQYHREMEKKRSAGLIPEMQIAEAQAAQAAARLKLVEYRLKNAQVRSPIDGVLVEGEPGKNLGGPVRRGDVVVKVAALSDLYVEASVREQDVTMIMIAQAVELHMLANPTEKHSMGVARVIPVPVAKEGENTFPVRLHASEKPPSWWRPGMSCVAHIDVGWKPLLWIITHRFVDYLRILLWI